MCLFLYFEVWLLFIFALPLSLSSMNILAVKFDIISSQYCTCIYG